MKKFIIIFSVLVVAALVAYGFMIGNVAAPEKPKVMPEMLKVKDAVVRYYADFNKVPASSGVLLKSNYVMEKELKDSWGTPFKLTYNKDTGICRITSNGEDLDLGTSDDIVYEFDPTVSEEQQSGGE